MIIFHNNQAIDIQSEESYKQFAKDFRILHAAGGIIQNEEDDVLMIFRLAHWDFPKGKVEDGETFAEAAVREVGEETGVQCVRIEEVLPSTFHTYELRGEPILKETHWFRMRTQRQTLVPQAIEDITRAEWVPKAQVADLLKESYPSLRALWADIQNL